MLFRSSGDPGWRRVEVARNRGAMRVSGYLFGSNAGQMTLEALVRRNHGMLSADLVVYPASYDWQQPTLSAVVDSPSSSAAARNDPHRAIARTASNSSRPCFDIVPPFATAHADLTRLSQAARGVRSAASSQGARPCR